MDKSCSADFVVCIFTVFVEIILRRLLKFGTEAEIAILSHFVFNGCCCLLRGASYYYVHSLLAWMECVFQSKTKKQCNFRGFVVFKDRILVKP